VTDRGKLITLVAGKCRPLFFTGDDDEVFMTRSLNVTPKTTEEDLIVRSGKSEAYVTIIKKLHQLLTDTKHRAASLRQQSDLYLSELLRAYS